MFNQDQNQHIQNEVKPPFKDSMQDIFALFAGVVISFFASPFIIRFTHIPVGNFANVATSGTFTPEFAHMAWSVIVYVLVCTSMAYYVHIKMTVSAAKMMMKPLSDEAHQPNAQPAKDGFFKVIYEHIKSFLFVMLILAALGSLTGCKSQEQIDAENSKKAQQEQALKRIEVQGYVSAETAKTTAIEQAKVDLVDAQNKPKYWLHEEMMAEMENEKNLEMETMKIEAENILQDMRIKAEQLAQAAWHELIKYTAVPFLKLAAMLGAFLLSLFMISRSFVAYSGKREEETTKRQHSDNQKEILLEIASGVPAEERGGIVNRILGGTASAALESKTAEV